MLTQYKTVGQLINKGKRVGFIVEVTDNKGSKKLLKLTDTKIKELMNNGEVFDIILTKRGFCFKNKLRKIKDLPKMNTKKTVVVKKQTESKLIIKEYTGKELESYIDMTGAKSYNKRDFVNNIITYCNNNTTKVLAISGLRGTGKTIGILQAITSLNDYNNTVYIEIDEKADIDCLDIRNLILNKYMDKKYIFIDEITRVKDLVNSSGFLSDNVCGKGRRVIISGTDSLALIKAKGAGLYHRMLSINVTLISYEEAKRTMSQTLSEYIRMGGLYEENQVIDNNSLYEYIETAVVDNIYNTLTKNKGITSLLNIEHIQDKRKIRLIVFRILYAIIYTNTRKVRPASLKNIINVFNVSSQTDEALIMSDIEKQFGLNSQIIVNELEVSDILRAMTEIGLLVKATNICKRTEENYYITNPSIVNQMLNTIVDTIVDSGFTTTRKEFLKSARGLIFESIVVAHTSKVSAKHNHRLYFYHDTDNREIDLIIEKTVPQGFDDLYLYYEIKMTSNSDIAVVKSRWINDPVIDTFMKSQGTIIGKGIIYGGETKTFTGFEDPNMQAPKGLTLQQLENQNQGIDLISAEDYLLHTEEKLSILETYTI